MYFTAYIVKKGLYVGHSPDVMELMLYNGRKVLVRGPSDGLHPGDLVQFCCGFNDYDLVDLENDQAPGTYYQIYHSSFFRITKQETINTFFEGVRILTPLTEKKSKLKKSGQTLKAFFMAPFISKAKVNGYDCSP